MININNIKIMTLAEQLRNESKNLLSEIPWLEEETVKHIRWNGKYSMICDKHIDKISKSWAIPERFWTPIADWARENGFRVSTSYNSYGVKSIVISL